MNEFKVDFSDTDIRKLAHSISNIDLTKKLPPTKDSSTELSLEIRRVESLISKLEKSNKYTSKDLKPYKEKLEKLKLRA